MNDFESLFALNPRNRVAAERIEAERKEQETRLEKKNNEIAQPILEAIERAKPFIDCGPGFNENTKYMASARLVVMLCMGMTARSDKLRDAYLTAVLRLLDKARDRWKSGAWADPFLTDEQAGTRI